MNGDPLAAAGPDADADAETFDRLFQEIYLRFHRRDGKRSGLTGASRAVLAHLSLTGPLSVGEAARHLDRAQSVVSEIVQQLEAKGLLERETDPQDRRRTLVWLSDTGFAALRRDREVLSVALLSRAMSRMPPGRRRALRDAVQGLLDADRGLDVDRAGADADRCPSGDPEAGPDTDGTGGRRHTDGTGGRRRGAGQEGNARDAEGPRPARPGEGDRGAGDDAAGGDASL